MINIFKIQAYIEVISDPSSQTQLIYKAWFQGSIDPDLVWENPGK